MIEAIKLANFKCFKTLALPLRHLTLLTGINGMGKSTLMQSLLLLRQSYLHNMLPKRGLLINGDLVDLGTAGDILYRGADADEISIAVSCGTEQLDWRFRYADQFDNVIPVLTEPESLPKIGPFQDNFHYIMAERIGPRAMYETSTYAVAQEKRIGRDGKYAVAYLDANAQNDVAPLLRLSKELPATVRAQIDAWLGEIAPGAHLSLLPYPELGRVTMGMTFGQESVKGRPFSAPNVGFGLSYVLPVLVALIASPVGTIILVENPEAHLNPKGQVAMGRLLALAAAAEIQVIVETHSDHILNGIRIAVKHKEVQPEIVAIHYFDRGQGDQNVHRFSSPKIDKDGRISEWPAGFFDQWEQSLDALLD